MIDLSFSDLKLFDTVVKTRNMSEAARTLRTTPAAVSNRIGRLEKRLGVALFHRTTRVIGVTELGLGYHAHVRKALDEFELACRDLADFGAKAKPLMIAVPESLPPILGPCLPRLQRCFPRLQIEILAAHAVGRWDKPQLSLAFGRYDPALPHHRFLPCGLSLCAAPSYLRTAGHPRSLEDLADHMTLAENGVVWHLAGPSGAVEFTPNSPIKTQSAATLLGATLAGMGIALRPDWEISEAVAAGQLQIVLPDHGAPAGHGIYAFCTCPGPEEEMLLDLIADELSARRTFLVATLSPLGAEPAASPAKKMTESAFA